MGGYRKKRVVLQEIMLTTCKRCERPMTYHYTAIRKYCSATCRELMRRKPPKEVLESRMCARCGKDISQERLRKKAKFCSNQCARPACATTAKLAPGTTGAIQELIVCADLLRRGFHVFRAQSPSCPCDLVAMRGDEMFRVEVKTGRRNGDGLITKIAYKHNVYDILATVIEGVITYDPSDFLE